MFSIDCGLECNDVLTSRTIPPYYSVLSTQTTTHNLLYFAPKVFALILWTVKYPQTYATVLDSTIRDIRSKQKFEFENFTETSFVQHGLLSV